MPLWPLGPGGALRRRSVNQVILAVDQRAYHQQASGRVYPAPERAVRMVLGVDPLTLAAVLALPALPLLLVLAALPQLRATAAPAPARRR